MNLGDLQIRLLDQLEESGTGFVTAADAVRLLNDAMLELADASEFHFARSTFAAGAALTYDLATLLSPNFQCVLGVWNPTSGRWLTPLSLDQLDAAAPRWMETTGEPAFYVARNWNAIIYPRVATSGPATRDLEVVYACAPPLLAQPADIVPQLPEEDALALVDGALATAYLEEKELSKFKLLAAEWEEKKERVRVWAASKMRDYTTVAGVRS